MSAAPSLRIQVVVYHHGAAQVRRLVESVGAAVRHASAAGAVGAVELRIGDCGEGPGDGVFGERAVARWGAEQGLADVALERFGANLGSAEGNNRLAAGAATDRLLLLNPDTYAAPTMISRLAGAFTPGVGAAEARQVPAEHPKAYDIETGRTEWVSAAALMLDRAAFDEVAGFDSEYFFLHGDDVDLSWRLRLAGYDLVTVPDAVVFHDKRFEDDGSVSAGPAERYHHVHGRLMLAARYGLADLGRTVRANAAASGDPEQQRALADFTAREAAGRVPQTLAGAGRVATAAGPHLAESRF